MSSEGIQPTAIHQAPKGIKELDSKNPVEKSFIGDYESTSTAEKKRDHELKDMEGQPERGQASALESPPGGEAIRIRCLNCDKVLYDPHILTCFHMLCKRCTERNTEEDKVRCPFEHCRKESNQDEVRPAGRGFAAYFYPDTFLSMDKAMEDDLLDDPPMTEGPYRNLRWFQEMEQIERMDRYGIGPPRYGQISHEMRIALYEEMTPPVYAASDYDRNRPVTLSNDLELEEIINTLCKNITEKEQFIVGFYACNETNKIVLDIEEGSLEKGTTFLQDVFKKKIENIETVFDFVEQTMRPIPVVATGAKIADLPEELKDSIAGSEPVYHDTLTQAHGYGTVTCLAETSGPNSQLYVLTTKHALKCSENQQSRIETDIVSSIGGTLTVVGASHVGHKGPIWVDPQHEPVLVREATNVPKDSRNKAVDITAIPLSQNCINMLDTNLLNDLKDYERSHDTQLLMVTKQGATSGETSGTIKKTDYYLNENGRVSGEFMVIFPNVENVEFARPGDSGSLIWGNRPIGVVVRSWEKYRYPQRGNMERTVALAVRLDNCIAALKCCGLEINKLKVYGTALPVDIPAAFIGQLNDGGVEQAMDMN